MRSAVPGSLVSASTNFSTHQASVLGSGMPGSVRSVCSVRVFDDAQDGALRLGSTERGCPCAGPAELVDETNPGGRRLCANDLGRSSDVEGDSAVVASIIETDQNALGKER